MKNQTNNEIIYSINVADIQNVANQFLDRRLTRKELLLVKESTADYIDWFQAIESAIQKHVHD
jgi:hypothetical protein